MGHGCWVVLPCRIIGFAGSPLRETQRLEYGEIIQADGDVRPYGRVEAGLIPTYNCRRVGHVEYGRCGMGFWGCIPLWDNRVIRLTPT